MALSKRALYQISGLYLIQRGRMYHILGTCQGKRIRRSTGEADLSRASRVLDELLAELESGYRAGADNSQTDWKKVAQWVCQRHRTSSKERGIPFSLQPADVYLAMKETGFRCSVSGIALSKQIGPNGPPDPWSPSIDRIENRHGYTPENIRVVALAANLAMNRWGFDVLLRLSRAVVRSANSVLPEILLASTIQAPETPQNTAQVIDYIKEVA